MNFIGNNLIYPDKAKSNGISGTCYITFMVNTDGAISDIMVLKGVPGCIECDMEAMRVIRSMPKWSPGKNNGVPVRVQHDMQIKFKLK
ncbi:MAG: energy transducer TonB [Bacteroidetes bacterium]|nr:energy transducer TonB [Bacteroidota bacterium]